MTYEMHGWSRGTIGSRHEWAPGLCTITIAVETEPFAAGQFFNIGLRLDQEFVRRSYSVASAPGTPLEIFLTRVEDGSLSPQLADLAIGSEVWVEPRPRGYFTLDYLPEAPDLWLIATGTGLGPYLSMVREGRVFERFEHVVLVHGARIGSHLAYAQELDALATQVERFTYVPVVSRETVAGALKGRVTSALTSGDLETRTARAISPESSHLMLCGNPAMIDDMMAALSERGLRRHRQRAPGQVTYEKYW